MQTWVDQPQVQELADAPTTQAAVMPEPRVLEDGPRATLIYPCRQARPDVLRDAIEGMVSPEGSVQSSAALNALIVADRSEVTRAVLDVLKEVDRPVAQLLVEARVVEVTLDNDLEYEIRHVLSIPPGNSLIQGADLTLETPGAEPTPVQGGHLNVRAWSNNGRALDSFVRLLVTRGRARILSSPNLIVSAGTEASIITGEEVPVQSATVVGGTVNTTTQFKRVGIKLRVLLLQITNDTARLEINPEVSTVTRFTTSGTTGITNPIVAIRNVSSTLTLKDGEILTVGGLLSSEDRLTTRGVPLLEDIPLLGLLFQSRRSQTVRTQLIFFMRVHVLREASPGEVRVHEPDAGLGFLDRLPSPPTTERSTSRSTR